MADNTVSDSDSIWENWYKIKAFILRWPLNQNSHNLLLRSYELILLGKLSWLLKVTLVPWTGESWPLKVTLGSLTWTVNVTIPNKRKRPQNILNKHYLNFAKKYKRVCFLATNKQTGSSSENRSFFCCFCLFLSSFFFLLLLLLFFYRCLNYFREFISLLSQ